MDRNKYVLFEKQTFNCLLTVIGIKILLDIFLELQEYHNYLFIYKILKDDSELPYHFIDITVLSLFVF